MTLDLLRETVLPAAFNRGGKKFVRCETDSSSVGEDQFQSNVVFLTAVVNTGKVETKIPLVVKLEPFDENVRQTFHSSEQFFNEVFMYDKVLPFINKNNIVEDIFGKFYYGVGSVNDSGHNVVVIENLKPSGYTLTKEKGFIDYNHLALAMSKLGRFHALSYAAKKQNPKEFKNIVSSFKDILSVEGSMLHPVISACFHRAMDPLMERGKHVEVLRKVLARTDKNVLDFLKVLVDPEEPTAVICHGDFCRNNILYKYDGNGKPVDAKFFDIATSRYSSPMIDVAFFLLLNSSRDVRQAHLDDLLKAYHQALCTAIPGTEVPTLEAVRNEYRRKAIYGFVHCSFFLPVMIFDNPFSGTLPAISHEEMICIQLSVGGDEATNLLSEMVEELVESGCLSLQHEFLQS